MWDLFCNFAAQMYLKIKKEISRRRVIFGNKPMEANRE